MHRFFPSLSFNSLFFNNYTVDPGLVGYSSWTHNLRYININAIKNTKVGETFRFEPFFSKRHVHFITLLVVVNIHLFRDPMYIPYIKYLQNVYLYLWTVYEYELLISKRETRDFFCCFILSRLYCSGKLFFVQFQEKSNQIENHLWWVIAMWYLYVSCWLCSSPIKKY